MGMSDRQVNAFVCYLEELIRRKRAERKETNCFRTWDLLETEIAEDQAILEKFLEFLRSPGNALGADRSTPGDVSVI